VEKARESKSNLKPSESIGASPSGSHQEHGERDDRNRHQEREHSTLTRKSREYEREIVLFVAGNGNHASRCLIRRPRRSEEDYLDGTEKANVKGLRVQRGALGGKNYSCQPQEDRIERSSA